MPWNLLCSTKLAADATLTQACDAEMEVDLDDSFCHTYSQHNNFICFIVLDLFNSISETDNGNDKIRFYYLACITCKYLQIM